MSFLYILAAIAMLGVMVTVHEFGHFLAARLTGIPVKEFAIGFGPRLLKWKSKKHETQFFLRLIPAGGYCMFYGEDDADGKEAKNDPRAIGKFAVWRRMVTIVMGPVMNFILALAVAVALFMGIGEDVGGTYDYPFVTAVERGSPAAEAGLREEDRLLSVNGEDARGLNADQTATKVSALINAYDPQGDALLLEIGRGEEKLQVRLMPRYNEAEGRYLMGVMLNSGYVPQYAPITLGRAISQGADYCVRAAGAILSGLKTLVTTGEGFSESAGPVGIVQMIAEETQKTGWITFAELLVLISVNLGLFNLIPIPGLDGSRIVFLIIEAIRRKPIPQKVEAYVHMSGYVILLGLMLVMTYKDILRIFR